MKMFLIANCIYLPLEGSSIKHQKYIGGSISGDLFPHQIYTEEEIRELHKGSSNKLHEVENLHELIKAWGPRLQLNS